MRSWARAARPVPSRDADPPLDAELGGVRDGRDVGDLSDEASREDTSTGDAPHASAPAASRRGMGTIAARGAAVSFSGQVMRIVIQMGGIAVMARLLSPTDYGLVAMVTVVVGLAEIFRDFGLSAAAIQSPTLTKAQRDNLFWANSALGASLYLLGVALSGVVASIFHEPAVAPITQVLSVMFLLNGVATQYRASMSRAMRFGSIVVVDLSAQVIGLVLGIAMALAGAEYWALVGMQIGQSAFALLGVILVSRWLPGWPRRHQPMSGFWRFGWNMVGTQLLGYVSNNADTFVIGRRLGPEPLGVYDRAYRLLVVPLAQIRTPTTTVALPVLSRLSNDKPTYARFLIAGQIALGYTVVAALAAAAGAADPLIRLFLGAQWSQSAPIFALLAIGGALDTLAYVGYWVYLSRGLTHRLFQYTVLSAVVRVVAIVVGASWGVVGVAFGYAIARALLWPVSWLWLGAVTEIPLRTLLTGGVRLLAMAAGCGVLSWSVVQLLAGWGPVVQLVAAGLVVVGYYAVMGLLVPAIRRDERTLVEAARRLRAR